MKFEFEDIDNSRSVSMYDYRQERVLLSPLGKTDPVRESFDGPMLHIVRHLRPSKVYLFMTKEILIAVPINL